MALHEKQSVIQPCPLAVELMSVALIYAGSDMLQCLHADAPHHGDALYLRSCHQHSAEGMGIVLIATVMQ